MCRPRRGSYYTNQSRCPPIARVAAVLYLSLLVCYAGGLSSRPMSPAETLDCVPVCSVLRCLDVSCSLPRIAGPVCQLQILLFAVLSATFVVVRSVSCRRSLK